MPMTTKAYWKKADGTIVASDDPGRYVIAAPYGSEQPASFFPAADVPRAPTLASIVPNTAVVGGPDITLQLTGTYFTNNCQVFFNNGVTSAAFVSTTSLKARISPSAAVAGTFPVYVADNWGHQTAPQTFTFTGGTQESPATEGTDTNAATDQSQNEG